jgi:hypothetical protein
MLAVLVAALLSAAPGADTVITSDGARITGTVVEESPSNGVLLETPDGSVRRLDRREIARIEFSDGSVSTYGAAAEEAPDAPPAPAPAPAPPPPPSAAPPAPPAPPPGSSPPAPSRRGSLDGPVDTIFFVGGGRVRGTVLEESPREGVTIRLLDGSVRQYARREIARIIYADGSVSRRRSAPPRQYATPPRPAYPPPAYPPPPAEPPAAPPQGWQPPASRPLGPVYLAAGVGATFFGGDAEDRFSMSDTFKPQGHVSLEGGLRLSPNIALGLYGDLGAGDPAGEVRDECALAGLDDCIATSGRIGFLLRHTWDPARATSKWLSIGTGWEFGSVSGDGPGDDDDELFTYTGREYVRLGGGVDFRSTGVLGVGFYGAVAWGSYDHIDTPVTDNIRIDDNALHTTVQVGVRFTLFP